MSTTTMEYRGYEITARYEDNRWVVTKGGEYVADFPATRAASAYIDSLEDRTPLPRSGGYRGPGRNRYRW